MIRVIWLYSCDFMVIFDGPWATVSIQFELAVRRFGWQWSKVNMDAALNKLDFGRCFLSFVQLPNLGSCSFWKRKFLSIYWCIIYLVPWWVQWNSFSIHFTQRPLKSVTNNPLSNRGGIIGIFALLRTLLIRDQYLLLEVPGFAKVRPILRR